MGVQSVVDELTAPVDALPAKEAPPEITTGVPLTASWQLLKVTFAESPAVMALELSASVRVSVAEPPAEHERVWVPGVDVLAASRTPSRETLIYSLS